MQTTEVIEEFLEHLPVDHDGSMAFSANMAHMKTLKICLTASVVMTLMLAAAALFALSRPPRVAIIRVDEVRGAELVQEGTPLDIRTAEVRTALWNWCIWRYRILKSSAKQDVGQSYYFLAAEVSAKYRDSDTRKVAAVLAGTDPEQTVDVRTIALPPMKRLEVGSKRLLTGQAQVELVTSENLNAPADPQDPTRKKWKINLEFAVDPIDSAKRGLDDPQYQILNPLGITITNYYETREPGDGR